MPFVHGQNNAFARLAVNTRRFVKDGGVTLNIDSAKAMESVVDHEITHVLEGTELYRELQKLAIDFAKSKGEYETRFKTLSGLYEDGTDIDAELTANIVGDYLFADADFIKSLSMENPNVFKRVWNEIKYLYKAATAGSKEARQLEKVKKTFEEAYRESGERTADAEVRYSVSEIIDTGGNNYGVGVILDSDLLTGLSDTERKQMIRLLVMEELSGNSFIAYNEGIPVEISIAKKNEKFENKSGKKVPVSKDLFSKYNGREIKQEAVVLADELIKASKQGRTEPSNYSHDWLDNYGKNDWEKRTVYLQDKNKAVWEAVLQIANSSDGRKILYDIIPIEKVEGSVKSAPTATNNSIQQSEKNASEIMSLSDNNIAPVNANSFNTYGRDIAIETADDKPGQVADDKTSRQSALEHVEPYSETQKNNWRNSKKIIIYENNAQATEFIKQAKNRENAGKKLYFGKIKDDVANRVEETVGYDIHGYNCALYSDNIRKIFKDHGNEDSESKRGQRAIKEEDVLRMPEIIANASSIARSGEYRGYPVIKFKMDEVTLVAVVSEGSLDLYSQTMYAGKKIEALHRRQMNEPLSIRPRRNEVQLLIIVYQILRIMQ